jgi:hypothetical protein
LHQISQRQKTDGERAYTDGRNGTDRPAIDPAGSPSPNGERDAVYGGQESNRWHCGGTDLDDYVGDVREDGMGDVADETH